MSPQSVFQWQKNVKNVKNVIRKSGSQLSSPVGQVYSDFFVPLAPLAPSVEVQDKTDCPRVTSKPHCFPNVSKNADTFSQGVKSP